VKASDISDGEMLAAIRADMDARQSHGIGAIASSVQELLGYPYKVVRAKARSMIRRGLLTGCDRIENCRGDWRPTAKALSPDGKSTEASE